MGKIGIFDSGVGGLNVLNDLIAHFPDQDYIYLADTKHAPYGTKSGSEVKKITENIIRYFESLVVDAIVIACNTATTQSYDIEATVPIIRIIEPTANQAKITGGRIAVLATNLTIDTRAYQKFIPDAIGIRASELVGIADLGLFDTNTSYNTLLGLLEPVKGKIDTLVLGCTHFSKYANQIREILGEINIVDSSAAISPIIGNYLEMKPGNGSIELITSGDEKILNSLWSMARDLKFSHVDF